MSSTQNEVQQPVQNPPLQVHTRLPGKAEFVGTTKSFESMLELFAGFSDIADENRVRLRNSWRYYLPPREDEGPVSRDRNRCMAYEPIVAARKSYSPVSRRGHAPAYFILILNSARDDRPQERRPGSDLLQERLIDTDMIMAEFDGFYLTPNGFPYHQYASLLIAQDRSRSQKDLPTPHDIESWMRFSMLTRQYLFMNAPGAGASQDRLHVQVVDPAAIRYEDGVVTYPILNEQIVTRSHIRPGIEVIEGYGIEALALRGADAPHLASLAIKKMRDEGHAYNIMVREKEVIVVARNPEKEVSHCIGKKVGAYEMSGVILVGNVYENLMQDIGHSKVVKGNQIFTDLSYDQISSNIKNATASLAGVQYKL